LSYGGGHFFSCIGIDVFRVFDSLNYLENLKLGVGGGPF
jgi:pyruvate carboxylase